jgi:hypothetical protein
MAKAMIAIGVRFAGLKACASTGARRFRGPEVLARPRGSLAVGWLAEALRFHCAGDQSCSLRSGREGDRYEGNGCRA